MGNTGSPGPGDSGPDPADILDLESDAPWLARTDWASGELEYRHGALRGVVPAILGLIFLFLSLLFAANVPNAIRDNNYTSIIPFFILFPLGLAVTVKSFLLMIGGIRTGPVTFHLDSVPVALGGRLVGELKMSKPIPAGQSVRLTLKCTSRKQVVRYRSDNDVDSSSRVLSQYGQTIVSDGSGIIPVSMVVPGAAPPTKLRPKSWSSDELTQTKTWVEWELTVDDPSAKAGEIHAAFELPVFKVGEIPPPPPVDLEAIRAAQTAEMEAYQPGPAFKVRIRSVPGGTTEVHFPPVRGAANAAAQTVVFLIMAAILVAVTSPLFTSLNDDAISHRGDWLAVALYAGWAILTFLLFLWVLRLWFAPERITIANGMLSYTSGLFRKTQTMPIAEITAIHAISGRYTRQNAIRIRGRLRHWLTVGDGIRDRRDADWLAMQMSLAIGVKPMASLPTDDYAEEMQVLRTFLKKTGTAPKQQSDVEKQDD